MNSVTTMRLMMSSNVARRGVMALNGFANINVVNNKSFGMMMTTTFASLPQKTSSVSTLETFQKRFNATESVHPKVVEEKDYVLHHPVYNKEQLEKVPIYHKDAEDLSDRVAYGAVKFMRAVFDKVTGYIPESTERTEGRITSEGSWMTRFLFLETIAGVPPFMAAMARHLRSLRRMQRDNGWIHTLLEEAENERMHLLTFLTLRKPGYIFRGMVIVAQGVLANAFFLAYLISPKTCHRFVGYIEEEAVHTYTHALREIDSGIGPLAVWKTKPAPEIAIKYWKLEPTATMRDVIAAIRVDESTHRDVNHTFGSLKPDEKNPF